MHRGQTVATQQIDNWQLIIDNWIMHRGLWEDREHRGCSSTCCQLVGADFMSARLPGRDKPYPYRYRLSTCLLVNLSTHLLNNVAIARDAGKECNDWERHRRWGEDLSERSESRSTVFQNRNLFWLEACNELSLAYFSLAVQREVKKGYREK